MSELWLIVAIASVFGAALLIGLALDQTSSQRKRTVRLLESQVSSSSTAESTNLREREMERGFGERVLVPVVGGATRIARKVTPLDARERIAKKLLLAGSPPGWDAERILAFKIIGCVGAFVAGLFISKLIGLQGLTGLLVIALLTIAGFLLPDSALSRKVEERQHEILSTLSDTLDLLTISVEAGLSLNAAIAQVVQNVPGTLSSEFARMLQEIQLGVPRSEAFRHLAERTDVEELNAFALAMIQADVFGVSIASVLRTQAQQLRIKRRQRAEARAQQTPVKIVFPLILCILPALFVVIIGPGVIRIMDQILGG
ncbi:MAG: type II secretion system F family protein [Actinomycetota bacterium]